MDQGRGPAQGGDRPNQHVQVQDELGHVSRSESAFLNFQSYLQGMNNIKVAGCLKVDRLSRDLTSTKKLPSSLPIKMNTLQDKQKRVTNFDDAVDMYNTWAIGTNGHPQLTQQIIKNRISEEDIIYAA